MKSITDIVGLINIKEKYLEHKKDLDEIVFKADEILVKKLNKNPNKREIGFTPIEIQSLRQAIASSKTKIENLHFDAHIDKIISEESKLTIEQRKEARADRGMLIRRIVSRMITTAGIILISALYLYVGTSNCWPIPKLIAPPGYEMGMCIHKNESKKDERDKDLISK